MFKYLMKISISDLLIEEIIIDNRYIIYSDGYIETTVPPKGSGCVPLRRVPTNKCKDGYHRIKYKKRTILLHRIIYRKFSGELQKDLFINHKDGNKDNNSSSNLELVTHSQNVKHTYDVLKRYPSIGGAKITYQIAQQIRELRQTGLKYSELAFKFGLTKSGIADIIKFRTWKTS